jgi:hypothetical protein
MRVPTSSTSRKCSISTTGYPYSEPRILPLDLNERMMALPRASVCFSQHRSSSPFCLI